MSPKQNLSSSQRGIEVEKIKSGYHQITSITSFCVIRVFGAQELVRKQDRINVEGLK